MERKGFVLQVVCTGLEQLPAVLVFHTNLP